MNLDLDAEGHLRDLSIWDEPVAGELARREGLTLSEERWAVIRLVRAFYRSTGVVPAMRPLVKLVQNELGPAKGSSLYLLSLFPGSPARVVAKLAGLPRPTNCI